MPSFHLIANSSLSKLLPSKLQDAGCQMLCKMLDAVCFSSLTFVVVGRDLTVSALVNNNQVY